MPNIIKWLLPREYKFFDMLKGHSSVMVEASRELKSFIGEYHNLSQISKKNLVKGLKDIEHKGDDSTHNILILLDKAFITPIDKEDIHKLTMLIDDVIDLIYAAAVKIHIFDLKNMDEFIVKLAGTILRIVSKTDELFLKIVKLNHMSQIYIDVHSLENEADEILYNALSELFKSKDPIYIIKYKEVYEILGAITDKCEDIANVIESVVVKHA